MKTKMTGRPERQNNVLVANEVFSVETKLISLTIEFTCTLCSKGFLQQFITEQLFNSFFLLCVCVIWE